MYNHVEVVVEWVMVVVEGVMVAAWEATVVVKAAQMMEVVGDGGPGGDCDP